MVMQIETVELDMDFAGEEEKKELEATKNRLAWKTLRLAAKKNMASFNKVSQQNLKGLVES